VSPERDPFRPQDPWKAEWDQHTERYRGDLNVPGGRFDLLVLLAIWATVIGVVVLVAAIAFVLLLMTVRV
jgi:hypothetical protein